MRGREDCDILVIGGGMAGATLARAMALHGHDVVIVEKEVEFRDRVRGEVLLPWGSVEAQELGIYDLLLAGCSREVMREHFSLGGIAFEPRDYRTSTPKATCGLSFYHPEMQSLLLQSAEDAGVRIIRGALVEALRPGDRPEADIAVNGQAQTIGARIIVGADGRASKTAAMLGFDRQRDPAELMIGGLQMAGDLDIEHALYFSLHDAGALGSILISNRPGNYRAYLLHHRDALPRPLSGERDFPEVKQRFAEIGWNAEWLERLDPHGIFATFDGAHQWIVDPAGMNCTLIGDAAGSSDPVWGNGLSRMLRDVRLLRDRLLDNSDWGRAIAAYAVDHDDFFFRLRRVEHLCAKLHFGSGADAVGRRQRAYGILNRHPELNPDMAGFGPDIAGIEDMERVLLG